MNSDKKNVDSKINLKINNIIKKYIESDNSIYFKIKDNNNKINYLKAGVNLLDINQKHGCEEDDILKFKFLKQYCAFEQFLSFNYTKDKSSKIAKQNDLIKKSTLLLLNGFNKEDKYYGIKFELLKNQLYELKEIRNNIVHEFSYPEFIINDTTMEIYYNKIKRINKLLFLSYIRDINKSNNEIIFIDKKELMDAWENWSMGGEYKLREDSYFINHIKNDFNRWFNIDFSKFVDSKKEKVLFVIDTYGGLMITNFFIKSKKIKKYIKSFQNKFYDISNLGEEELSTNYLIIPSKDVFDEITKNINEIYNKLNNMQYAIFIPGKMHYSITFAMGFFAGKYGIYKKSDLFLQIKYYNQDQNNDQKINNNINTFNYSLINVSTELSKIIKNKQQVQSNEFWEINSIKQYDIFNSTPKIIVYCGSQDLVNNNNFNEDSVQINPIFSNKQSNNNLQIIKDEFIYHARNIINLINSKIQSERNISFLFFHIPKALIFLLGCYYSDKIVKLYEYGRKSVNEEKEIILVLTLN